MRKYVKSNDGYALVIALLVITVVTVLGLGILTTTSSSKKLSEEESKDQTAYYIAEAGLNQKKEELKDAKVVYDDFVKSVKDQKLTKEQFVNKLRTFAEGRLSEQLKPVEYGTDLFQRKNAKANVKTVMNVSETELKFTITSTGIIKSTDSANEKKRTVQSVDSYKLAITEKPAEEEFGTSKYVVHALGDFKFGGGSIVGNLGFKQSEKDKPSIFPFSGTYGTFQGKSGKVYACATWDKTKDCLNPGIANGDLVFNDSELPKIPDFPKEKFISLDTITQPPNVTNIQQGLPTKRPIPSGNYRVTIAELTQSTILDIDTNNVTLLIADADFKNTNLTFIGNGNLKIITNDFKTSGNPALVDFDKNNTEIYSTNFKILEGNKDQNNSIKTNGSLKIFNTNQVIFSGDAKLHSTEDITIYSKGSFSQIESAGITSAKNLNIFSNSVVLSSDMTMTINNEMNVYAYTTFDANNTITIESKKTNIFYTGNTIPIFNGGFKNPINLDFLNSSLNLGGSTSIIGNIILRGENNTQTKNTVTINGGSNNTTPLYLYAPKFNVLLDNGISFFGSIIGNDVNVVNANITYKQPPPNNGGSTGGSTGSGQIDSSLTPNPDGGSIEID